MTKRLKRFSIISLILLFLFSLSGCRRQKESNITLLYTTDAHGRIMTDDETIGLDTIAAIKNNAQNAVLVDAGDFLHGTSVVEKTQGEDVIKLMKETGYMAAVIGEDDFNYGLNVLLTRVEDAKKGKDTFHIVNSNIQNKDGTKLFDEYAIVKADGLKIGFFGLTTDEVNTDASNELQFLDIVTQANHMVQMLKKQNCNLIVALSHVGNDRNAKLNSIEIAKQVDGVDFIVDGHTHRTMEATINDTLVVSSGNYGSYVGQISITYDHAKKEILKKENSLISKEKSLLITPDEDIARHIANLQN